MKTELEAMAQCIVVGLGENAGAWGKEQATKATAHALKLNRAKEIDDGMLATLIGRLSNQSATRQHLEKQAIIKIAPDALAIAIKSYQAQDAKLRAAELAKL